MKALLMMTAIASGTIFANTVDDRRMNKMRELYKDPKSPTINILTLEQWGYTSEEIDKEMKRKLIVRDKGYSEEKSFGAYQMLSLKQDGYAFSSSNEKNPGSTDLKKDLSSIPLTFKFNGISFIPKKDILGWAASNTFNEGWSGIAEYFNYPKIGVCNYEIRHAKSSGGKIYLEAHLINKDINGKYTGYSVNGNQEDGFLYTLRWYDNTHFHALECAQKTFSRDTEKNMIELAKMIDIDIK